MDDQVVAEVAPKEHILVARDGAVQTMRFNRADKKNAITRAMYASLTQALDEGEKDDEVRVHLIAGQPGVFTSGNDLQDFLAFAMGGAMGSEVVDFLVRMATLKKPFVSAIDGLAIGIGATLNLHCDLTFATSQSLFKTPFVDLALVPEAASSLLGPAIMGHQRAFAMFAMGESFDAQQALEAGLIYQIVEADALEQTAMAAAKALADKPPQALKMAKALMKPNEDEVLDRIREECEQFAERLKSDEAKAAFMAFMTRKKDG